MPKCMCDDLPIDRNEKAPSESWIAHQQKRHFVREFCVALGLHEPSGRVVLCNRAAAGELHALPGMAPGRQQARHVLSRHSPCDAVQMSTTLCRQQHSEQMMMDRRGSNCRGVRRQAVASVIVNSSSPSAYRCQRCSAVHHHHLMSMDLRHSIIFMA